MSFEIVACITSIISVLSKSLFDRIEKHGIMLSKYIQVKQNKFFTRLI